MEELLWILASTVLISLISLVGIFTLALKHKSLEKMLLFLVSLSAGALMGGAFLHLIPEAVDIGGDTVYIWVLVGFLLFFLVEKVLHWRHCHKGNCHVHTFAYMNLVGDSVHNFIDGLILAASFLADVNLGIVTTLAVALHEIPQEIGDFGVLVYGKIKKTKALLLNFMTALTAILGGLIGYVISGQVESFTAYLLPFAAGGFIYIAASDLIPEIRKEVQLKKSLYLFSVLILGIFIMYSVKLIF